jgi:predicted membrane channel-forming protein YqfA (hemolysin III family)
MAPARPSATGEVHSVREEFFNALTHGLGATACVSTGSISARHDAHSGRS